MANDIINMLFGNKREDQLFQTNGQWVICVHHEPSKFWPLPETVFQSTKIKTETVRLNKISLAGNLVGVAGECSCGKVYYKILDRGERNEH